MIIYILARVKICVDDLQDKYCKLWRMYTVIFLEWLRKESD